MLLTGKIKTIISTGSPDYIICGEASSALSLSNLAFRLDIGKANLGSENLVDTTDLSTFVVSGTPTTYTFGSYDIEFADFQIDAASSTWQATLNVYYTGTTDVVTWEKFYAYISIAKAGYQRFENTFELYNYDVGNASSLGSLTDTTGNTDFEVILINNTNNLDAFGIQTRAASSFITLRRPFTDEIHVYNMIATQGGITYNTNDGVVGSGNHIIVVNSEDLYFEQTVNLVGDYCTTGKYAYKAVWQPKFVSNFTSANTCDGCTNNIADTTVSYYNDATDVTVFRVNGVDRFLSEFMLNKVYIYVYNYLSTIITSDISTVALTYAAWIATPSAFTTPYEFTFVPSEIGNNTITVTNLFGYDVVAESDRLIELIQCTQAYDLPTCNWFTVEPQVNCGDYIITNCSAQTLTVVIQKMDDNKAFVEVSSNTILAYETLEVAFATDGIYMLKLSSSLITGFKYYSLPIFCALQTCFVDKLNESICHKITAENCDVNVHYEINALIINAVSYFLLLNQEFNYNFVYTSLPTDKINELYTLKTFIDRFVEYCACNDTPCLPCKQ